MIFLTIMKEIKKYRVNFEDLDKIDISEIFKAGSSSKGKDRGYGLSNVKKIVEQNNGDVLIEISDEIISIKVILT